MTTRYVLAPEAALDLVEIWQYIKEHAGVTVADRVESTILERVGFLAGTPGAGPLGHSSVKITEKFYGAWVKSRQEALDSEIRKAWAL